MAVNAEAVTESRRNTDKGASLNQAQTPFVAGGLIVAAVLTIFLIITQNTAQPLLFIIGLLLGYTLFHARFGFTSAFRRFASVGNGKALRAHMVMLAAAVTLFAPILAVGTTFFGGEATGNIAPIGISLLVGAFLFGLGMQLGGGCASGTLYAVGSGRTMMFVTLLFFIVGATLGAYHLDFWTNDLPSFGAVSLAESTGLGYFGAWIVSILIFGVIIWWTLQREKKKNPPKMADLPKVAGWKRIFRGSWPLLTAAVVLAVLNALTLLTRGSGWGVTSAFTLWGSKVASAFGVDPSTWGYWQGNAEALQTTIFADTTTVLNFGVILGAFLASAAGGLFRFSNLNMKNVSAAVIGGLFMGYGARLAFGCNIGAYFTGIASFSLHGYLWGILAMAGTFVALFLRPLFGLSVPKSNDSFC